MRSSRGRSAVGLLGVPARERLGRGGGNGSVARPAGRGGGLARRWRVTTGVATAGMAMPPLGLYAVSALAPFLTVEWDLSRAAVGLLVSIMFGVAAGTSLVAGQVVDVVGERRGLLCLAAMLAVAMSVASFAQSYQWLVVAVAMSGAALALANPTTNL